MKKLIILFGIAMAMQLASESDSNPQTEEKIPDWAENLTIYSDGEIVEEIPPDTLVSDLTVYQLQWLLQDAVGKCKVVGNGVHIFCKMKWAN
jgi:hypothetical protein